MSQKSPSGLVFLHALPLDGSMWDDYADLLPGKSFAPTLYGFGRNVEEWAQSVLALAPGDRLIVVGCSVGGSCALELAAAAPDRVAALVLIGTKAKHHPDPALQAAVLESIAKDGMDGAWARYWAPLFSKSADEGVVQAARAMALRHRPEEIARGVTAFHSRLSRDRIVSDFQGPVDVVTGDEDIAPERSARLADSARHGRLHVVPSCGHYVPLEKPDRLKAILQDAVAAFV